MSVIIKTDWGTVVEDGIEYNEHPYPPSLIKATEAKWARKLKDCGVIRLNSIRFYQSLENAELGDRNEGNGMLRLNGRPMESGSVNEVFIWCSALNTTPHEILKGFSANYDTIIEIMDVVEFTKRIQKAALDVGYDLTPHLGLVQYNRGEEVTKKVLNEQKWHSNVFQKDGGYSHQQEYRFAFSNFTFNHIGSDYIDLVLGNCNDIIQFIS